MELDDVVYRFCYQLLGDEPGFYIEVGAHDGHTQSNTARLERRLGWRGILIEPSIQYEKLVASRSNENVFIRAALVEDEAVTEISGLFHGTLGGTGDPDLMDFFRKSPKPLSAAERFRVAYRQIRRRLKGRNLSNPGKELVSVAALTLSQVVRRSGPSQIDFFSLDVEGMELQALEGFDFSVRPRAILVETRARDALKISLLLTKQGYMMTRVFGSLNPDDLKEPGLSCLNLLWVLAEDEAALEATRDL